MGLKELFKIVGLVTVDGVDKAKTELDGVTNTAEKSSDSMVSSFKKIGAAVATYFTVDAITNFGKQLVDAAASVSAETSAFEQIMGDYTDTAKQKMQEVADATGVVDTRLTGYMTSMTAKFKGLGFDIDEATTLAQEGLMLASDAAAFWDKSLEDSMGALNSFINGNYEGGEAIGLFANDTQMAAYAVKQGLVETTSAWASLDEATKQATRLEYAQNMFEMSGATGQAAKEADQYANVQGNLNEKWRQFKAQIGEPLLQNVVLPAMQALMDIIDDLSKGFEELQKWLSENEETVNNVLTAVVALTGAFVAYKAAMAISGIISAVTKALDGMTIAQWALNAAMNANPIMLIVTAIGALVAAFAYLWTTNEDFRNFWIETWGAISTFFMDTWNSIVNFVTVTIPEAFNAMIQWFANLPTNIANWLQQALTTVTTWATNMVNKAIEVGTNFFNNIMTFFQQLPYNIGYVIGQVLGSIIQWGLDMYNWVITQVPLIIQSIVDFFAQLPSKVMQWLQNTLNNVVTWGKNMLNQAKTTASNFLNTIIQFIQQIPSKVMQWLTDTFNKVVQWGSDLINKGKEIISNFVTAVVDGIKDLPNKFLDIGKNVVNGFVNGVKSMISSAINAVGSFFSGIVDGAKSMLGINSPSKVFAEIGKFTGEGYEQGFAKSMGEVNDLVAETAKGIVSTAQGEFAKLDAPDIASDISVNRRTIAEPFDINPTEATQKPSVTPQNNEKIIFMDDIKDKLDSIVDALSDLLSNMNMRVVLDTGVLVGEMTPMIDEEMGDIKRRKER